MPRDSDEAPKTKKKKVEDMEEKRPILDIHVRKRS